MLRSSGVYSRLRCHVAVAAQHETVAAVSARFGVSRMFVRYWRRKLVDPSFHPLGEGGQSLIHGGRGACALFCLAGGDPGQPGENH